MLKKTMEELGRLNTSSFKNSEKMPIVILLDNVRSMHNVGSVFRTADGFRLEKIWLCGFTPQPPHREIHKTALGATETVDWTYQQDALTCALQLKEQGYLIWAVEQAKNAIFLQEVVPSPHQPIVLVFGNEVEGVNESILAIADAVIEIPQGGMKHSLNISVSAGIVVWDLVAKLGMKWAQK